MGNLHQLGATVMQYAQANRGAVPPTLDALVTGLPAVRFGPILNCPKCAGNAAKPPATVGAVVSSNYVYCPPGPRVTIRGAASTVLAYEPLTNHDGRGAAFLFCDGHAEWHLSATAAPLLAQVAARTAPTTSASTQPAAINGSTGATR